MAYTRTWSNSTPLGTAQADTLETIIQHLKADIEERMQEWFGVTNMATTGSQLASFGAWVAKSSDTAYEALTDGFVVAKADGVVNGTNYLQMLTDGSNPPTTVRQYLHGCPVKSGDYWKVTETGTLTGVTIFWIPLS